MNKKGVLLALAMILMVILFFVVGQALSAPLETLSVCGDNSPGDPTILPVENDEGLVVGICSFWPPYVDGQPTTYVELEFWNYEVSLGEGQHVLTTTYTFLEFEVVRLDVPGEVFAYGDMEVTAGDFDVNVVAYDQGGRHLLNPTGWGFGTFGIEEYWNFSTGEWQTAPIWGYRNILSHVPPTETYLPLMFG